MKKADKALDSAKTARQAFEDFAEAIEKRGLLFLANQDRKRAIKKTGRKLR